MGDAVKPWPKVAGRAELKPPKPIVRPCDYGLQLAVMNLEAQLGTIEAYNRLARAAYELHRRIEAGQAQPQNPIFAVDVRGASPGDRDQHRKAKPAAAGGVRKIAAKEPDRHA